MSNGFHVIEDGKLPDHDPDEWLVFVDSPANAAMWLEAGEPVLAFNAVEGVVGFRAYESLIGLGWPVEYDTATMPKVPHSGHLVSRTLEQGSDYAATLPSPLPEVAEAALGALSSLAYARSAIEAASGDAVRVIAEVAARGVLAGFAARVLGVDALSLIQPNPERARAARLEYQELWRNEVRRYLKGLHSTNPVLLKLPAGEIWTAFQQEKAAWVEKTKGNPTVQWPKDDTAETFIRSERKAIGQD